MMNLNKQKKEKLKMKKGIVLLVMLVFALALSAQTSIAATDNFMAAKVNPAAMGVGNNG